jgi:hypothetical protein
MKPLLSVPAVSHWVEHFCCQDPNYENPSLPQLRALLGTFGHSPELGHNLRYVIFDVFTAVTMKNAVFRDVTPCGSCKNRCYGET